MGKTKRPLTLRRASAYYRLASKAERAGNYTGGAHYRKIADRLVRENQARKLAARRPEGA
jgi:hypothetical protein